MCEDKLPDWDILYLCLLEKARERHQGKIKIKTKSELKWFWKMLQFILKVLTFGKAPAIYDRFFTVIGRTIWLAGDGSSWSKFPWWQKYSLLSHELDHMDYCYFGRSDIRDEDHIEIKNWKGMEAPWYWKLWYNFKYLFWPMPILYAYGRQDIEIKGYRRNMEVNIQMFGEIQEHPHPFYFSSVHFCELYVDGYQEKGRRVDTERTRRR